MRALLIEMRCPKHGFERFSVKVTKRVNIPKKEIKCRFRSHPNPGISSLLVRREVNDAEIERYLLPEKGVVDQILHIKKKY